MQIPAGFTDVKLIKTLPISVNSILSASYLYINGGSEWPFSSFSLINVKVKEIPKNSVKFSITHFSIYSNDFNHYNSTTDRDDIRKIPHNIL